MNYSNKCRLKIYPNKSTDIKLPFNISNIEKNIVLKYFNKIISFIGDIEEPFKFEINPLKIHMVCSSKSALGVLTKSKIKKLILL